MSKQSVLLTAVTLTAASLAALVGVSYAPNKGTLVKLRAFVHLYNWMKSGERELTDDEITKKTESVRDLFKQVLEAERRAFGDDEACDRSKTALFEAQLVGIFAPGNRFSSFGQALSLKDTAKFLTRRLLFADYVSGLEDKPSLETSSIIIIAGLPRTGSTLLHRVLSVDTSTRTPLW